ncbi:MAG: hypothetical protein KDD29_00940 [Flavobacteriales bacterium]|nr:hypothetical protein [Flavobacteriales bacterium]
MKKSFLILFLLLVSILAYSQKNKVLMIFIDSSTKTNWKIVSSYACKEGLIKKNIINTELEPNYTLGLSASKELNYPSDCNISIEIFIGNSDYPISVFTFNDIKNNSQLKISGGLRYKNEDKEEFTPYVEYYLQQKKKFEFY